jgi:hypothetical protein
MQPMITRGKSKMHIYEPHFGSLPFEFEMKPFDRTLEAYGFPYADSVRLECSYVASDEGVGKVCIGNLFAIDGDIEPHELAERMHYCRHASVMELLSFSLLYPDTQRYFPIVAGGARGRGPDREVLPYLTCNGSLRDLEFVRIGLQRTGAKFLLIADS